MSLAYPYDVRLKQRIARNVAEFSARHRPANGLKRAAVAATVVRGEDGEAGVIVTKRVSRLRAHSNQWAIPGGRLDEGESHEQAALRELEEEVGLHLRPEAVLGSLDDYPTRSGYLIRPVVLWAGPRVKLRRNPHEVASIHVFPLLELDRPDSPHIFAIPESDRPVIRVPYGDTEIYAPTAAMLYQFREVAVHGRQTRVDGFDQPVFAWR
jgi:8-oxo-dGTP pyrophosphatase MutT (NUDIX family)